MTIEAMKQALEALEKIDVAMPFPVGRSAITSLRQAIAEAKKQEIDKPSKQKRPQNCGTSFCSCIECVMDEQEPVTLLPDGSAFGVMSFPLPDDHWLYTPNEYRDGEYEPLDLPKPILTHALRNEVVAAVRYAVRSATMRGQEKDFDPDALVQNAVYALCGPYNTAQPKREPLTDEQIGDIAALFYPRWQGHEGFARAIEAAHGIKENT